jgi:hypothetical protein
MKTTFRATLTILLISVPTYADTLLYNCLLTSGYQHYWAEKTANESLIPALENAGLSHRLLKSSIRRISVMEKWCYGIVIETADVNAQQAIRGVIGDSFKGAPVNYVINP